MLQITGSSWNTIDTRNLINQMPQRFWRTVNRTEKMLNVGESYLPYSTGSPTPICTIESAKSFSLVHSIHRAKINF